MNRRIMFLAMLATPALVLLPCSASAAAPPKLAVYRNPGCGCCEGWVEHMRAAGFTADIIDDAERASRRLSLGISDDNASCHTALIGGYAIEGHVPAADVIHLLTEKPADVTGLTVPGMPQGSPGMGPVGSGPPYDTLLIRNNGSSTVYATHQR